MAFFIWFDNDNLDYGGIGVVEYRSPVDEIMVRGRRTVRRLAGNDNPPLAFLPGQDLSLCGSMEPASAAECER